MSLEPLPPYPAFSREIKRSNAALIITLIIVAVLFIVVALIVYLVFKTRAAIVINRCEPGLCVVTLANGEKRCPNTNDEQLSYTIAFEDCTSRNYCQSSKAPCAVLAGGVLDCHGVCGAGNDQCNCLKIG